MAVFNLNDDITLAYLLGKVKKEVKGWITSAFDTLQNGKVDRAGDTMTGILHGRMSSPGFYLESTSRTDGVAPSSDTNAAGFRIRDKNNANIAVYTDRWYANGRQGAWLAGFRAGVANSLCLLVDADGNRVINVSEEKPWQEALNILSRLATYYSAAAGNVIDTMTDGTALVATTTTINASLYNALKSNYAYVIQVFYSAVGSTRNRVQIAFPYNKAKTVFAWRIYESSWGSWQVVDMGSKLGNTGDIASNYIGVKGNYVSNGTVTENKYSTQFLLYDSEDANVGLLRTVKYTGGNEALDLIARRKINGSDVYNTLQLVIKSDGSRVVAVTDATPWRNALGLGTGGELPITIAQGGSGQTGSTSTTTASSIITAASGITILAANYAQWGKMAQIYIRWKSSSAVTVTADGNATNVTVGTLVSGKRPKIQSACLSMGDSAGPAFYYIDTEGKLLLCACGGTGATRTIAAGTEFYCMGTYILA